MMRLQKRSRRLAQCLLGEFKERTGWLLSFVRRRVKATIMSNGFPDAFDLDCENVVRGELIGQVPDKK